MSAENGANGASIELRLVPTEPGRSKVECDWGVIEYARARPPDEVGHLILVSKQGFCDLLRHGPNSLGVPGTMSRATFTGFGETLRRFFHLDYNGQRWTWELFDAHWADGCSFQVYIGRWPD